jgi:hypothetical protein
MSCFDLPLKWDIEVGESALCTDDGALDGRMCSMVSNQKYTVDFDIR